MYVTSNRLHGIDLSSGIDTDYGGAPGYVFFGGAFSPDGTRFAYVRATSLTEASLRILTFATGAVAALRSFTTNTYDVPKLWTPSMIVSFDVVGFSDAGFQGVSKLDPATGARGTHSTIDGRGNLVVSADATRAAYSSHTNLGDEGDVPGALYPGPQNTLKSLAIGSPATTVMQAAHHAIRPLALSTDGSKLLVSDDPSAGGVAGISTSPDFGLLLYTGTTKSQVATFGSRWDAAVFLDTTSFVASRVDSGVATLARWTGSSFGTLDTMGTETLGLFAV
jgi:hypothetical protein